MTSNDEDDRIRNASENEPGPNERQRTAGEMNNREKKKGGWEGGKQSLLFRRFRAFEPAPKTTPRGRKHTLVGQESKTQLPAQTGGEKGRTEGTTLRAAKKRTREGPRGKKFRKRTGKKRTKKSVRPVGKTPKGGKNSPVNHKAERRQPTAQGISHAEKEEEARPHASKPAYEGTCKKERERGRSRGRMGKDEPQVL